MQFSNYFRLGQKILLRTLDPSVALDRMEAISVYLKDIGTDHFDLTLPYGSSEEERYPFSMNMPVEILSDAMGLGVRMTGSFHSQLSGETIRVKINDDLQIFRRRYNPRFDLSVGLRYTKGRGTLRSFKEQWEKNTRILKSGNPLNLPEFPRCIANLSAGGIRVAIKAPVRAADLLLLLLQIEENAPPLCILAEVVWADETEDNGRIMVGMQFLQILESDKERIVKFLKRKESELS